MSLSHVYFMAFTLLFGRTSKAVLSDVALNLKRYNFLAQT